MLKISLTNFVPLYCPECGAKLNADAQALAGGCSDACPLCGSLYQQCPTNDLINTAAESGGDLECLLLTDRLIAVTGGVMA